MATLLLHPFPPGPSKGILLNPSPGASPAYHPASLPALIPSNSSLSSSASSLAAGDSSDYFSKSASSSPGPSHSLPSNNNVHTKQRTDSNPSTVRRIRFAPLPEPRRDDDMLDPVFLDDDDMDQPLTMRSALATAGVSLTAPVDADLTKHAHSVTSSPHAARKCLPSESLLLGCSRDDCPGPSSESEAQHAPECGHEWDLARSPSPAAQPGPAFAPGSPRKGGKWTKMLGPLLGRSGRSHSSPLAMFSAEDVSALNDDAHRGRRNSNHSGHGHRPGSSRESSVSHERSGSDFGAPLNRWTSEGAPGAGLPLSSKKRLSLFGGGSNGGVPLGRTQSLTSLSGKDDKKGKPATAAPQRAGGRKQTRMLNGRVYGAKRNPNAKNPFANVRYVCCSRLDCDRSFPVPFSLSSEDNRISLLVHLRVFRFLIGLVEWMLTPCMTDRTDEPEFVEWGYGGMGSVKNTAGQSSVWSRVQADNNAAGIARKATEDEDDGTGMAWVRKRKEERERAKREAEERAKKEQEAREANAENADVEMNTESEVTDAKETDTEADAEVEVKVTAAEAVEQNEKADEAENAPLSPNATVTSTPAPPTPLASEGQKSPAHVEHITQAINIPAPHRHHSHSHSYSHTLPHHHHSHTLSLSRIDTRESGDTVRPLASPMKSPLVTPKHESAERASVSSSGASTASEDGEDGDSEDSPKDSGFCNEEDSEEEEEEQVSPLFVAGRREAAGTDRVWCYRSGVVSLRSARAWRRSRDTTRRSKVRQQLGRPLRRRVKLRLSLYAPSDPVAESASPSPPLLTTLMIYCDTPSPNRQGHAQNACHWTPGSHTQRGRDSRRPHFGRSAGVPIRDWCRCSL